MSSSNSSECHVKCSLLFLHDGTNILGCPLSGQRHKFSPKLKAFFQCSYQCSPWRFSGGGNCSGWKLLPPKKGLCENPDPRCRSALWPKEQTTGYCHPELRRTSSSGGTILHFTKWRGSSSELCTHVPPNHPDLTFCRKHGIQWWFTCQNQLKHTDVILRRTYTEDL